LRSGWRRHIPSDRDQPSLGVIIDVGLVSTYEARDHVTVLVVRVQISVRERRDRVHMSRIIRVSHACFA